MQVNFYVLYTNIDTTRRLVYNNERIVNSRKGDRFENHHQDHGLRKSHVPAATQAEKTAETRPLLADFDSPPLYLRHDGQWIYI